MEMLIEVKSES